MGDVCGGKGVLRMHFWGVLNLPVQDWGVIKTWFWYHYTVHLVIFIMPIFLHNVCYRHRLMLYEILFDVRFNLSPHV